ncbi:MAG: 1,4-dihydroxy-6-naphthoate synthase [Bacteroidota bacterium]
MKLSLGISPCPNDTFIFDAMLHGKIDTEGLQFEYRLEDVETLNKMALTGELDITKVSYGALARLMVHYKVLDAGGALGLGVGPLLVSHHCADISELDPASAIIALPGAYTTAHLLFHLSYPSFQKKIFMPFHLIEEAVLSSEVHAGVIIHENRFTYAERGLKKLADLGDKWEQKTGFPIPLGGILSKRHFDGTLLRKINRVIRNSIEYAFSHRATLPPFVLEHAQSMSESVMNQHIDLYVNEYSRGLGSNGRAAVWKLLELAAALHPVPQNSNFEVFVD